MSEKEVVLSTPIIELSDDNLIVQYDAVNSNAMYDFCSLEGRILITGKMGLEKEVQLDLSGYPKGAYSLFILDGDQIYKNTLKL